MPKNMCRKIKKKPVESFWKSCQYSGQPPATSWARKRGRRRPQWQPIPAHLAQISKYKKAPFFCYCCGWFWLSSEESPEKAETCWRRRIGNWRRRGKKRPNGVVLLSTAGERRRWRWRWRLPFSLLDFSVWVCKCVCARWVHQFVSAAHIYVGLF